MAERRDKKNVNSNDKTVVDSNVKNVSQEEQVQSRNLRTEEQKSTGKSESKENVVPKLEQKEEQVEAETLRNTRDVRKVKDELKREKMFNSFNGWLSIITFGLLVSHQTFYVSFKVENICKVIRLTCKVRNGISSSDKDTSKCIVSV